MERHIAEQVLTALFYASGKMNDTLWLILNECTKHEFIAYRRGSDGQRDTSFWALLG